MALQSLDVKNVSGRTSTPPSARTTLPIAKLVDGLQKGERYAQTGAFTLKSQLAKASFGDGHAH